MVGWPFSFCLSARRTGTVLALLALGVIATLALSSCAGAKTTSQRIDSAAKPQPKRAGSGNKVKLRRVGTFSAPTYLTSAPGFPKLEFVTEQAGRVMVLRGSHKVRHPFLDLRGMVTSGGEEGLLSMAFPPDYPRSRRFYVAYTTSANALQVDEFKRRSATRAAAGSRRPVITIQHPGETNHDGGQLEFDGNLLYIGTGDGGAENDPHQNGQNKNVLLGKLLRIDPRAANGRSYTIPADNPFVGKPGLPEIYSYGLRNPWRFSFDHVTPGAAKIVIADVGQDRFEEVDYTTVQGASGANFGWNAFEGFAPFTGPTASPDPGNTIRPIFAYSHAHGCSITGGYVVGPGGPAALHGRYVYSDYCAGDLRSFVPRLSGARHDHGLGLHVDSPSSFGVDQHGRIYVCSLTGPVYRLK
jgi:glucose/arabinose dehydrogenase